MDFDAPPTKSPWNSLEKAKLGMGIITPVVIVIVGYFIWSIQNDAIQHQQSVLEAEKFKIQNEQTEKSRIREFRWDLYQKAGPLLNDIFAYHFYVGRWKEFGPDVILKKKRELDTLMYSHESLLSAGFFEQYRSFMDQTFKPAGGWYTDARIRTESRCRMRLPSEQEKDWASHFTEEDNRKQVCSAYKNLLGSLSKELLFVSLPGKGVACPTEYATSECLQPHKLIPDQP
jgi:hypothetical protein